MISGTLWWMLNNGSQSYPGPNPGSCEYVPLHTWQKDFEDKIKDLGMRELFWSIWIDSMFHKGPYKWEAG
jgi:hypothetical protein